MGRVKAATFIETVIAAVIILALFAMTSTTFVAVTNRKNNFLHAKAIMMINTGAARAVEDGRFKDLVEYIGAFRFEQAVIEVINNRTIHMRFAVYDRRGEMLEQQERILITP